jgi:hypothetical protein
MEKKYLLVEYIQKKKKALREYESQLAQISQKA